MGPYVLAVDQSTQGTKAVLFAADGRLVAKTARPHRQIICDNGFVEHDPAEISANVVQVMREVVELAGIAGAEVAAVGVSNQRETCMAWDRASGEPLYHAVVWQCARAKGLCDELVAERPQAAARGNRALAVGQLRGHDPRVRRAEGRARQVPSVRGE